MRILLTGDYFNNYQIDKKDFIELKKNFQRYDFVVLNYEGTFKSKIKLNKSIHLSMSQNSLNLPKNSVLNLCNNHFYDFGEAGLKKLIKQIKKKKIKYFGLNKNINNLSNYVILKLKEKKLFISSLGCKNEECVTATKTRIGVLDFTKDSINKSFEISEKFKFDFKILYVHGGYEWEKYPLPEHVGLSRYAIDLGFDMVYFSHTHTIQDYEFYKKKLIHYGLGNFYFSSFQKKYPIIADKGACIELNLKNKKISIRNIKFQRSKNTTKIDKSNRIKIKNLKYDSLELYSEKYKDFRTRKKNPRPILYYEKDYTNKFKFFLWKFIVDILGMLRIRKQVKKILKWN